MVTEVVGYVCLVVSPVVVHSGGMTRILSPLLVLLNEVLLLIEEVSHSILHVNIEQRAQAVRVLSVKYVYQLTVISPDLDSDFLPPLL